MYFPFLNVNCQTKIFVFLQITMPCKELINLYGKENLQKPIKSFCLNKKLDLTS